MQASVLVPVKGKPGLFYNTVTKTYTFIGEWAEGNKYDTVKQAAGAITAGTEKNFFRDLTDKENIHTNLTTQRRLPAGEEMVVDRVWAYIPTAVGNTEALPIDIKKVAEAGYIKFQINRKDVSEGPLVMFPSGYGLVGNSVANNQGVVSIGVASTAAAAKMKREQYITSEHDMDAKLTFCALATWDSSTAMPTTTNIVYVKAGFHGTIRSAATK